MDDDILDSLTTEPDWVTEVDAADAKRAEERLIPTGTYEGQITAHEVRMGERPGPFFGQPRVHCTVELYNVPGSFGGVSTRPHWFDVCPVNITLDNGDMSGESRLWGHLVKVSGTEGKRASETMAAVKQMRLRFRVRKGKATEQYPARNWTDAITLPKA